MTVHFYFGRGFLMNCPVKGPFIFREDDILHHIIPSATQLRTRDVISVDTKVFQQIIRAKIHAKT